MAEEEIEFELKGFKKELESLFVTNSSEEYGLQSKLYCVRFCKVRNVLKSHLEKRKSCFFPPQYRLELANVS